MRQPVGPEPCTNVETLLTHDSGALGIVELSPPPVEFMLLVFDIPFHAPHGEAWTIALPCGEQHIFPTRHDAVRFAARQATRLTSLDGSHAYLSIEGEDGVWRLFGSDLKAPTL